MTISKPEAVTPFAELGIVLLLFSIGLELSFRRLWSMRRIVFGVGAAELVGGAVIIAAGLHVMGQAIPGSIGLGLALALSSTAIVLPLVGSHSAVGRAALGMLLFEDLALVPIVFALGAMSPSATAGVGPLLGTLLLGGAVALGLLFGGRLLLPILFAQAARTKNPEVFLAACLLVVIVASMVTSAIGFSAVLGALIAGIVIAETEYRGEVEAITAPFRGLGLGIFLITVGMSVNLRQLVANWQTVLIALVAVLAVKALITAALLRLNGSRTGGRRRNRRADGLALGNHADRARLRERGSADPAGDGGFLADRHRARPDDHAACSASSGTSPDSAWTERATPRSATRCARAARARW